MSSRLHLGCRSRKMYKRLRKLKRTRTLVTAISLMAFAFVMQWYLKHFTDPLSDACQMKSIFYGDLLFAGLVYKADRYFSLKSWIHESFNNMLLWSVIICFALFLAYYRHYIESVTEMYTLFLVIEVFTLFLTVYLALKNKAL